jgi:tetratricopeptide (TPR) repeat protein/DNA-binding transcriptional ArsR family regulator
MDLSFFNPRSQSEADFIESFVARAGTLEFFLRQLRQLGPDEAARHQLIVAPRGFGKTSLLRRIAIAVRAEDALCKRYLPLSFREEQHNVISLDVFWRNCLQSLLEAREEEHASEAELDAIDAAWVRLAPRQALPRGAQDGDPAWHEFSHRCAQLDRRPILLIDNLDTLLAGLDKDHQWSLRQTLQRSDGPVVIAAASRYPESTHNQEAAFYDFFRIQTLDRLENAEVLLCLRTLARHRGEAGKPVLALLDSDPGRVAALNTLAGGNPRTLGVLYGVLESHMSTDVLSQLSAMLDTFTGWYQARTEELPMQARAVFDALALNWDPMTAAAVGQSTGLETTTVSSQLSRLEKMGYVEAVALSHRGKGRSGFQVVERFFNIWYLMRNGPRRARQSIKFLTVFLQSCFSAPERRSLGRRAIDLERIDPEYALALASTFRDGPLRERLLQRADEASSQSAANSEYQSLIRSLQPQLAKTTQRASEDPNDPNDPNDPTLPTSESQPNTNPEVGLQGGTSEPAASAELTAELQQGRDLLKRGSASEILAVYDNVVSRFGEASDPAMRVRVARALVNKGITLGQLGRSEDAIAVYDNVVSQFGEASDPALREQVARALVNKGFRLAQLGRSEEAIVVYDNVISRFGEASDLALRDQVGRALVAKGVCLGQLGRSEEAIAVYDNVISRFGEASDTALRDYVARGLVNKGVRLGQLGRSEEEMAVYDNVISRFGDASDLALRERVARALVNKGVTLGQLGRREEAIVVYDNVISRFSEASDPDLRDQVARALINKGFRLAQLGRSEEAMVVYDNVISRFGEASDPDMRARVARALFYKGITLSQLSRIEEAIAVYDNVISRFGEASDPALLDQVARALVNKGITLGQLDRSEEAIAAYDNVISRFGEASDLAFRDQVGRALVAKGLRLGQLGRSEEAIAVYDKVFSRFGEASELALRERVAQALLNKGLTLGQLGRIEEAIAVYDKVFSRFGEASDPALREQVARALVNKGIRLAQLGRSEEAIVVYDNVISLFGEASDPALREAVVLAEKRKANALIESGQIDRAEAALRSGIKRQPLTADLWNSLGNLFLDAKGDPVAAESAYLQGLSVDDTSAILHANCAYVMALHTGDHQRAQRQIQLALASDETEISAAGRYLLTALPKSSDADSVEWSDVFNGIGRAVESGDAAIWTNYMDDLQRLLWFVIAHKRGDRLREWMIAEDYPLRHAPLYHAVVAAIEGEDHLLQINPETRGPAMRIFQGLSRRLQMYAIRSKKPPRRRISST